MTAYGLTPRQSELMTFLATYDRDRGYAPTFDEMMKALGYQSKSSIDRLLNALEERGHICRIPNRSRSTSIARPA
ncbi:LexA family protein [Phyllobacterium calauticae]|jgi:repressor LexA|uniref:LexA family protein n=1 Tax=Phyllobacterium calauticae TaxID=2817027 RepID=UPI001CC03E68|nr:hypothetical protein [Phyllobacterium calauticae]MBZ3691010.1 hypothetical protein [Phyllobacterium calauticae]